MDKRANERCCGNCVYAEQPQGRWLRAILSRWPGLRLCFHCDQAMGQMAEVTVAGTCPNFRPRRKPVVRTEPPEPESDDVRYITLTQGKHAIVDAADYPELSRHKWHTLAPGSNDRFYAVRNGKGRTLYMHRQIMNPPEGMVVDHIDGNGLNNRRSNLRICTPFENAQNRHRPRRGASRFLGVRRARDKWDATVGHQGHTHYVGCFDDEEEAAKARDRKKLELAGEFAALNFPEEAAQ